MTVLSAVSTFAIIGFGNRPPITPMKPTKAPAQHGRETTWPVRDPNILRILKAL
jgi:hypothetical protein